jgi:plastocyanin
MRSIALVALLGVLLVSLAPTRAPAQVQTQMRPRVIEVQMVSYKFVPDLITVRQGETVVLRMVNSDPEKRNHSIAARLFVDAEPTARGDVFRTGVAEERRFFAAEPGKSFELEFTARQRGTFPFVCSVFDHATKGQTGAINILPASP